MPFPFTCPHCGSAMTVDEQYAGSTGPCRSCGQEITIPFAPPRRSSGVPLAVIVVCVLGVLFICGGVLTALLLPAVQSAREAARRAQCMNNLKQIGLAMHNYHAACGRFPPAFSANAAGRPLQSWRVALLPYLEEESLFRQIQRDEPWDSPGNKPLTGVRQPLFGCASDAKIAPAETNYVVITGPKTVFDGSRSCRVSDITDGTSNTILAVEVKGLGISWAEPRDITEEQFLDAFANHTLASPHPGGFNAVMCDGSVHFLRPDIPVETLRLLVERSDGQVVPAWDD